MTDKFTTMAKLAMTNSTDKMATRFNDWQSPFVYLIGGNLFSVRPLWQIVNCLSVQFYFTLTTQVLVYFSGKNH